MQEELNQTPPPSRNFGGDNGRYDSGIKALFHSLKMAFAGLIVVIIGMLIYFVGFDSAFQVQPQDAVIVMRFGSPIGVYNSGWKWFMPYPVTSYVRIPVTQQTLSVEFNSAPTGRPDAAPDIRRPLEPGRDRYLLTADANIVHTSWLLTYKIIDPERYYFGIATPENPMDADQLETDDAGNPIGRRGPQTLLYNLVTNAVIQTTAGLNADEVLYSKQAEYALQVQRTLVETLGELNLGIEVDSLLLQQSSVPVAVKPAFDMAQAAGAAQDTAIRQALAYATEMASTAQYQSEAIRAEANSYKKQVVEMIAADASYFEKILEAYQQNPQATLIPLYFDTVGAVVAQAKDKYLLGGDGNKWVRLRLNPEPDADPMNNSEVQP